MELTVAFFQFTIVLTAILVAVIVVLSQALVSLAHQSGGNTHNHFTIFVVLTPASHQERGQPHANGGQAPTNQSSDSHPSDLPTADPPTSKAAASEPSPVKLITAGPPKKAQAQPVATDATTNASHWSKLVESSLATLLIRWSCVKILTSLVPRELAQKFETGQNASKTALVGVRDIAQAVKKLCKIKKAQRKQALLAYPTSNNFQKATVEDSDEQSTTKANGSHGGNPPQSTSTPVSLPSIGLAQPEAATPATSKAEVESAPTPEQARKIMAGGSGQPEAKAPLDESSASTSRKRKSPVPMLIEPSTGIDAGRKKRKVFNEDPAEKKGKSKASELDKNKFKATVEDVNEANEPQTLPAHQYKDERADCTAQLNERMQQNANHFAREAKAKENGGFFVSEKRARDAFENAGESSARPAKKMDTSKPFLPGAVDIPLVRKRKSAPQDDVSLALGNQKEQQTRKLKKSRTSKWERDHDEFMS